MPWGILFANQDDDNEEGFKESELKHQLHQRIEGGYTKQSSMV
jgi:hypothetical protein